MMLWNFLIRIFSFAKKYYKYPKYVFVYGLNYLNPFFASGVHFYSHNEFAEEIRKGRSVVRFGDGEMHIMNGGSIHYQKYEKGLSLAMRELVEEYRDTSPYVLALPVFLNRTNAKLRKEGKFFVWMPAKVMYKILFPKRAHYSDAHFFYYDGFFQKYLEGYLIDKHLVVVSNENTINSLKDNKNIPFKNMSFVIVPKENSYSDYKKIFDEVDHAVKNTPRKEKVVLLFSAGPTSKKLVYEFSRKGLQSLDIGRGLEVFYKDESIEILFPELLQGKNLNSF